MEMRLKALRALQDLVIFTARPYVVRELPGWGRLFAAMVGDYQRNWFWAAAPIKTIRGKRHGYLMRLDLSKWAELLQNAAAMNMDEFISIIQKKNLRNSVFIDITASDAIAKTYPQLLQKSISVVACNKVACSSSYEYYKNLKDLAREFNALFLFETNVGAGLPVIGTLNDLLRSGDEVKRIEAVLSGTLNFVFNNYNGEKSFAKVVRQAQDEGYTEPDPRLDLSGIDVMRKIMILARSTGFKAVSTIMAFSNG